MENDPQQQRRLVLKGNLQIDTAINVLREQKIGSTVLGLLELLHSQFAPLMGRLGDGDLTIAFEDTEARLELIDALETYLQREDIDDFQRITAEELLEIQRNPPLDDEDD